MPFGTSANGRRTTASNSSSRINFTHSTQRSFSRPPFSTGGLLATRVIGESGEQRTNRGGPSVTNPSAIVCFASLRKIFDAKLAENVARLGLIIFGWRRREKFVTAGAANQRKGPSVVGLPFLGSSIEFSLALAPLISARCGSADVNAVGGRAPRARRARIAAPVVG
jgi:hypothetical protein